MAVIHRTTLKPTKLELLTAWLPTRPWHRGSAAPELSKAGGFRLDDPEGAVGIEFMVVNDTSGGRATAYLVPLTYRGAPLADAEHALIGTAEHGVLGRRWIYDGCHDPVLIAQLTALLEGQVAAQDQNTTDTPDPTITVSYTATPAGPAETGTTDDRDGTILPGPSGAALRLHRVLQPAARPATTGHITGPWSNSDGTKASGPFLTVHPRH
ncbi:1,4-alpha-glucan branching protein [Nonomuraea sp. NPDC004580]|uniref:maltokinase N-terminal cap-like domain-containing protein n=1 Tax=Nonomuraea sp. NPDC004580 TaxID=3154552 RepID=UPI0033B68FEE